MSFNISNVLSLLLLQFEACGPIPKSPKTSRKEQKVANHLINLIQQADNGDMEIEEDDELNLEEDGDWEAPEFDALDHDDVQPHLTIRFGNRWMSREDVDKAIAHYRQTGKGSRPAQSMFTRFRWLSSANHLQKLRDIEEAGDSYKGDRCRMLELLADRLFEEVKKRFDMGISLHDKDLQTLALDINRKEFEIKDFCASHKWITRWKSNRRIVSRKVTKFVTRRCLVDKKDIEKNAKDFVRTCKQEMSLFDPATVFNADQTGIQKELHGARALAFMGEQVVERIVQSKSSLTHSFTFLPMIFANGTMGPKAYMVIAEPTGSFPPSRPIPNPPNLVIRAGKSHIMTKDMMCDWLSSCVFHSSCPSKLYMLVDSWPSFKDHQKIRSCMPSGVDLTIRNIPPHCTGLIQPLDRYWNLPWKNLIKKFTSHAMTFYPDYTIAQRNNQIWMVAVLYHQISAALFTPFLEYSWKKCGYTDPRLTVFQTPSQYCFDGVGFEDCSTSGCTKLSFIHCSRCQDFLCFDHFVITTQHICPHS